MFKKLIQKSKKIIFLFTIVPLSFVSINDSKTPNKVSFEINKETLIKIEESQKKLIKNVDLDSLINKINKTNNQYITIFIDSNFNLIHSKSVAGIIDTKFKLNNISNDLVGNFFLPKNIDFDLIDKIKIQYNNFPDNLINGNINDAILKKIDYYKAIENIDKDKKIFINESFTHNKIFDNSKLSLDNLNQFKYDINKYNKEALETIEFLNKNNNVILVKAAGNNFEFNEKRGNDVLKLLFDKISNNNYKLTKELIPFFNLIIKNKIEEKPLNSNLIAFLEDFQELCKIKDVNYDNFINLYIKDYLIHYENLTLFEASKQLTHDNLKIVEAINYDNILIKYNDFKNHLLKIKDTKTILDLELIFKEINIKENKFYDSNEILKIKELYENYKDKYPEIFKYSVEGTFSNFINHQNKIFKASVEGHDSYYENKSFTGTSAACPEYLSDLVIETINNDQKLNINNLGDNK